MNAQEIADCQADLLDFSKAMFRETRGIEFVENWHHRKITDTLERVFLGDIKRLIINIPPRYSKTELAVINFIAWSLGIVPDAEFIHVSYSATLAKLASAKAKALIESEGYRTVFPDVVLKVDTKAKNHWGTTAGGVVYATGSGGTITGFGAGKMGRDGFGGCFPYDQLIDTENGPLKIGDIVTNKIKVRVWTLNELTGKSELKPISNYWDNGRNHVIEVRSKEGESFRCTPDHEFLGSSGQWVRAVHLADTFNLMDGQSRSQADFLSGNGSIVRNLYNFLRVLGFCVPEPALKSCGYTLPSFSHLNLSDYAKTYVKHFVQPRNRQVRLVNETDFPPRELCAGTFFQKGKCTVSDGILHVLGFRPVFEILNSIIKLVSVQVSQLRFLERTGTDETFGDKVSDKTRFDLAFNGQSNTGVPFSVKTPFKRTNRERPSNISEIRNLIKPEGVGNFTPDFAVYTGIENTYCLGICGNHNFRLHQSGVIASNCIIVDDPIKPDDANSETIRTGVNEWFMETLQSRTNDPETPIIVIMQRLHEDDLTGFLMKGGTGEKWQQLVLPARNEKTGAALWPAKHTLEELARIETSNPYVFAGQYQQRPAPLGGGTFKDEWWRFYSVLPPSLDYRIITADTAQKTKQKNDYSVFQCWGAKSRQAYLIDQIRGKWEAPELLIKAQAFWNKHHSLGATTGRLRAMYIEDKVSGTGLIQTLRREGCVPVIPIQRNIDKVTRAMDAAPFIASGYVHLPTGAPWLSDYMAEFSRFTPLMTHEFDDQIDPTLDAIGIISSSVGARAGTW